MCRGMRLHPDLAADTEPHALWGGATPRHVGARQQKLLVLQRVRVQLRRGGVRGPGRVRVPLRHG